jgi:hypothetical protein
MKIVSANVTGSFILNGVDLTTTVESSSIWSGSIASRVSNLEQFSSSLDSTYATDVQLNAVTQSVNTLSSSFLSYTSSTDDKIAQLYSSTSSINNATASLYAATASLYAATASLYTATASLNSYTSSNTMNIANLFATSASLNAAVADIRNTTASLFAATASIYNATSSLNAYTASATLRINALDQYTASLNTRSASFACVTATNNFACTQYFSNTSNAVGFSSTGSLYSDGGMRITKDMYVSGTAFFNNVTVFGTQSVAYISSSQLNIGTNIISVNTDTPSVRFGGLAVYDSGSTGLTGSMLWDSEQNHWVYTNPSGSTYSGGMFISGPRASSLGTEQGTTSCMLLAGQGGDHLTSSAIYHSSTVTCIPSALSTSGTATFNGCVNVNTGNQIRLYNSAKNNWVQIDSPLTAGDAAIDFKLTTQSGILYINNTGVACFNNAICAPRAELTSDASCVPLRLINGVITGGDTTGVTALYFGDAGSGVSMMQREKYAANQANLVLYSEYGYNTQSINACFGYNGVAFYTAGTKRQSIDGNGITCFASTVCAPFLSAGDGTQCNADDAPLTIKRGVGFAGLDFKSLRTTGNIGGTRFHDCAGVVQAQQLVEVDGSFNFYNASSNNRFKITSTGEACFACQVCAPLFLTSGCIGIGTSTYYGKVSVGNVPACAYGLSTFSTDWGNSGGGSTWTGIKIGSAADTGAAGVDIRAYTYYSTTAATSMAFFTNTSSNTLTEKLRIASDGIACFAGTICVPTYGFTGAPNS